MRRSASPRLVAPHTNGDGERPLVDVVRLVGRGEHLGLVDVVDAERLEDLRLGEVADPALRHHRDRDGGLDLLDHRGVRHAGDAAVATDVGGDALERHHRGGAGVLGDPGLLGVDDVHDHAAAQHLGEPTLDAGSAGGTGFRHGPESTGRLFADPQGLPRCYRRRRRTSRGRTARPTSTG